MLRFRIIIIVFIPLAITLLLTIIIPISLILVANPQYQQIYKTLKITNQQTVSRSLINLDKINLTNTFQIFQDIRNQLINIYLNPLNITIPTNTNYTNYTCNTGNMSNNIIAYTNALIGNNPNILQISWVINNNTYCYYVSDKTNNQKYHNMAVSNYNNDSNLQYSTFSDGQGNYIISSLCLSYNLTLLLSPDNYTINIGTSNYISQIFFLLVTPNINDAPIQIISYNPQVSQTLNFSNASFDYIQNNFNNFLSQFNSTWLYNSNYNLLLLYQLNKYAFYQVPIQITSYNNHTIRLFNLLAISSQLNLDFSFTFTSNNFLTIILIPMGLFTICSILSLLILRKILNKLLKQINYLVNKSALLIEGDLEIQIPDYVGTFEIQKIYQKIRILNYLAKFTDSKYFQGNNSEKSIKYFTALGIFKQLKKVTSMGYVYENLAGLSAQQRQYQKAIQYYKQSLAIIQQQILLKLSSRSIRQLYLSLHNQNKKIPRNMRKLQIVLMRRSFNLIQTMFKYIQLHKYKDQSMIQQVIIQIQTLMLVFFMKQNQPRQALLAAIRAQIWINVKNYLKVQQNFDIIQQIYSDYERAYLNNKLRFKIPPQIIVQYLKYLKGIYQQTKQNYAQALNLLLLSFDGDNYDPSIRQKALIAIKKILISQNLYTFTIKNSIYFTPKNNQPKQYIFLADFSKSVQTGFQETLTKTIYSTKKKLIIQQIIRIYTKYIKEKDRVSLIKFSSQIQIIFNLTQKGRSQKILKQSIQSLKDEQLVGRTALYSSMKVVLSTVKKLKRHKILIILLDGADNCSRTSVSEIKQLLQQIQEMTLLIIGIDLQDQTIHTLQSIASLCKRGYVVDKQDADDIDRILKVKDFIKVFIETYIC